MIKPKHSFGKSNITFKINEEFVNREHAKKLFSDSMNPSADSYKVIMYHGVGGIGKSSLKKELISIHNNTYGSNAIRFHLDFSSPENRNPGEALISLVDSCESKTKHRFECFEIAYSLYFRKKYPDTAYNREKEDLANKFGIGLSIVSIFDSGITQTTVNIVDKFAKLLRNRKLDDDMKEDLKNFDNLSINEIEERLPAYFEYDLSYLKAKNPEINVIFMIDTFEALNVYENEVIHRNKNERWVKDFLAYFPGYLFVIYGREKLQWEKEWADYIELCELKNLEIDYSYEYLKKAGITNEKILNKIVDSCKGYPFYLSLALKTYSDIVNDGRSPTETDFGKSYSDIIERFVYNLCADEVELLKILSIPRFYTREVFELLIRKFIPGYSITRFSHFNEYSFISNEKFKYFIHLLMKDGLKKYIDNETLMLVHEILFDYYGKSFKSQNLKDLFSEMVYHKCEMSSINDFKLWIEGANLDYLSDLQRRGEQDYIINIILMIINKYGLQEIPIELVNIYIDIVHLGGNYEDAISICENYLTSFNNEEIINDKNILRIAIRKIHHSMFYYPVNDLVESALKLIENEALLEYKDEYGELLFLIGGNLGLLTGDFEFAEQWLNKAFSYAKQNNNPDLELRVIRKLVDILSVRDKTEEALELCKRYISIDSELESRYHLYLLGALGEIYRKLQMFNEAQYCFDRLERITLQRNLPGWVAHSYLGQAMLCLHIGDVDKGLEYTRKAKEIYKKINQIWGKINSETVEIILLLKCNDNDDYVLEKLYDIRNEAHLMNYSYNVIAVNKLIENKNYDSFHLLFL